jgi:hypothetical protein
LYVFHKRKFPKVTSETQVSYVNEAPRALLIYVHEWMDGWMDGWVGGWMDGWVEVIKNSLRPVLRAAQDG